MPRRPRRAFAPQIELPRNELNRLQQRIEDDYQAALDEHDARMQRFQRYYQLWRALDSAPVLGQEDARYRKPLLQWQVFGKWAKEMDSLFGDNAELRCEPVGPSDARTAHKVSRFMNWRVFQSMKAVQPAALFSFRKILFGRAHAYCPWDKRTFRMPMEGGGWKVETSYDGPGFFNIWPDDLLTPAEEATLIDDFTFVLHKGRRSPQDMLDLEDAGQMAGITKIFEELSVRAEGNRSRDWESEKIQITADEAEGVTRDSALNLNGKLRVWNWFGRWRNLKGRQDARPENLSRRERFESDLLVRYLPDVQRIVGVQDLAEMYPLSEKRRPFVEASLTQEGSYWGPGFGELLEKAEAEMSRAHNLGARAGAFAVGPVVFYTGDSGLDEEKFEMEPHTAYPLQNVNGIKVVEFKADLTYPIAVGQDIGADTERVTGMNDQNLGRQADRPNTPRTARQFVGLIEEGNVRASLDVTVMREDWSRICSWLWSLEGMYGSPKTFFRVTEEQAKGQFDVSRGGAWMTSEERDGKYDFSLKLATSAQSREAEKDRLLELYGLLLQNPYFIANATAVALITRRVCEAMGREDVAEMIPIPPDSGRAFTPDEEWVKCLQGEDISVHPDDLDQDHLMQHFEQIKEQREEPGTIDEGAIDAMSKHIGEHQMQIRQKQLMNALVQQLTTQLAGNIGGKAGLMPGGQSMSLTQLQQTLGALTSGQDPNAAPGAPGAPGGAPPGPPAPGGPAPGAPPPPQQPPMA